MHRDRRHGSARFSNKPTPNRIRFVPARGEPARGIEMLGVRVAHDVDRRSSCRPCRRATVLDQRPPDPLPPRLRLDKERIQF